MTQWEVDRFIDKWFYPFFIGGILFLLIGCVIDEKSKKKKGDR